MKVIDEFPKSLDIQNSVICSQCAQKFPSETKLNNQKQIDHCQNKLTCDQCAWKFSGKMELNNHKQINHSQSRVICN